MALIRKRSKKMDLSEANVNITALMDVLVVLLFFLIKSFSVSASQLNPPKDLRLPASMVETPVEEALLISLSHGELRGKGELLTGLVRGSFQTMDIGDDGRTILPLKQFLDQEIKKRNELYGENIDVSKLPPAKILIQADRRLRFQTMKYLLLKLTCQIVIIV